MKTFTDNAGRTWTVLMNLDTAKRVKSLLDVNLLEADKGDPPSRAIAPASAGEGPTPLQRLATDLMFICDVVYVAIKPQADKLGVTDVQFAEAMGGDAMLAAHNALMEELADFFRKAGRTHLAKAIGLQTRTINLTIQALDKKVEAMTPEALLDQAVKTDPSAVAQAKADGSSSTSSPASSESTPAR